MKHILKYFFVIGMITILTACHSRDDNTFKVGTISGPETELMEVAKKVAQDQYHLTVKVIEFSDYLQPNAALNDGSLDANMFQHQAFLDQEIQNKHYELVVVGKTFIYPMGIYSKKIKSLSDIRSESLVALPNDPSNEGRALLLLEKAKLISLNPKAGLYPTLQDVVNNPKKLKFKELDASQVVRSLPDVDIGVINTNYAIPAGLFPTKDAIFLEGKDSPYANIIVVRKDEVNDPRVKQLVAAFQSDDVLKKANVLFKGQAIPAW